MAILITVLGLIAIFVFFMYDLAYKQYVKQLKRTIASQNAVIKQQHELIKTMKSE